MRLTLASLCRVESEAVAMNAQSIHLSRAWYLVSAAILTGAVALIGRAVVGIVSVIHTVDGFQRGA